ncbi:MAG: PAS domain S-box protein [Gammaproteobacteria bacterium]|nr:PAS domain S-box protein [Gammaproteobacteria bacterium]
MTTVFPAEIDMLPAHDRGALGIAIFDAWITPICVLDEHGVIVVANQMWRDLATARGGDLRRMAEGANYLAVAEAFAAQPGADDYATEFCDHLRAVLAGELQRFDQEYPCDAPHERRWFQARMRAFQFDGRLHVGVVHIDITALKRAELRAAAQVEIMEKVASSASLNEVLGTIVSCVERENPALLCSIQLLNEDGSRLVHAAGPSLPRDYLAAISSIPVAPALGCCGTAAFTGRRAISDDIAIDSRWRDYRAAALGAGLRACWSEPIRDAAGRVVGTFATYQRQPGAPSADDLASIENAARFAAVAIERRRSEEALYESEARFTHAFEDSAVGVAFIHADGSMFKVNRALCQLLGYDEAELTGRNFRDLTHDEDRARSEDFVQRLRSGQLESFQHEKRYLHKSGRAVWGLVSVSMIRGERGQPMYAVAQILDVSGLHAAREERELVFRHSLDLLCVADISGHFKQLNPAWQRVLGWSIEELISQPYMYWVHPEDVSPTRQAAVRLAAGQSITEFENRYRCRDGSYRLLSWNAFPLPDDGTMLAVVRDVTARKAAEEARREAEARLREGQKLESLGALAGGIAHDFNNLLAVILGNVEIAERARGEAGANDDPLRQIQLAARRALDLVQQIMAFSRRQPQQLRVLNLADVVQEALRLLRATIPAGVEIEAQLDVAAPPVRADATQMHQVMMNLCTNAWLALKSASVRRPRIEVSLRAVPNDAAAPAGLRSELPAGPLVCLEVSDNGAGMDAATAARVFEPFFTTRAPGEGTGLGLSVVHGIVAAHNGAIALASTPGQGSCFRVFLPASAQPLIGDAPERPARTAQRGSRALRVLFIDDEPALVNLAEALLEDDGHQVSGHTDPDAALAALRTNPGAYDLVVSDYNMPTQSGIDVARAVCGIAPGLPVIIASGYITPELQQAAAAHGVRLLLHKPDMVTRLAAAVTEVAEARRDV